MEYQLSDIKILYEDRSLIVCVKPCGLASQKDPTGNQDLLTLLNEKYKDIYLVHRLDTATGGVMIYARGKASAGKLSEAVQNHETFKKTYLAVLDKAPEQPEGELVDFLYHDKRQNKSFVVKSDRKGSKEAKLEYKVLEVNENGNALVCIRLLTGRSHQIRVQFASRKTPVYGDGKYGSRCKMKGFALWSSKLEFNHPFTKERIECECLPEQELTPWSFFKTL
ncbi:MAG: RluA family pseudouridine synthase [Bacilli bacterium]|nr:RluA family pseudouridine synthase [Bacilli bacterium]